MNKVAIIWDLDGTLIDSYTSLIDSMYNTCKHFNYPYHKSYLYQYFINFSLTDFVNKFIEDNHIDREEFIDYYRSHSTDTLMNVSLMKNAKETLDELNKMGVMNFMYTHKGDITDYILNNLEINNAFKEVITKHKGFKRKPDPEGINYFVDKYDLNRGSTFYIGDRRLDIECANNANVKSILFNDPKCFPHYNYGETYLVKDLYDIVDIIKKEMQ